MKSVEQRRRERERWHGLSPLPALPTDVKLTDRVIAVRMVNKAIRDGILKPWPVCAVPTCNQRFVLAHHTSYAPGDRLYVTWLCRRCHTELHREHRARTLRKPTVTGAFPTHS